MVKKNNSQDFWLIEMKQFGLSYFPGVDFRFPVDERYFHIICILYRYSGLF